MSWHLHPLGPGDVVEVLPGPRGSGRVYRLLQTGQFRIAEVAAEVEFRVHIHFSRTFKSIVGVPRASS